MVLRKLVINKNLSIRLVFFIYVFLTILIAMYWELLANEGFLIWERGFVKFIDQLMIWLIVGGVVIISNFLMENIKSFRLETKLDKKEDEILKLKAQLSDQQNSRNQDIPAKRKEKAAI